MGRTGENRQRRGRSRSKPRIAQARDRVVEVLREARKAGPGQGTKVGSENAAVVAADLATRVIISRKRTPLMPVVQRKIGVLIKKSPPDSYLILN